MATPQINGATASTTEWAQGQSCSFTVSGSQFASSATVQLTDTRATWGPAAYDQRTSKNVRFHSSPTNINSGILMGIGALTITVTNPPASSAQTNIQGYYILPTPPPSTSTKPPGSEES